MRGLSGKWVLISGGSSGIGLATGQRFLEEGARVVVGGLDAAEVTAAVAALRTFGEASGVPGDVSRDQDAARLIEAAASALGGLDVLINNAGIARRDSFLTITAKAWDRILAVNLRGMFLVAQTAGRLMAQQGTGGVIVNMSSTNGIAGEEDFAHYNASKGGVLLLTKTMAVELGHLGIRVNALCPGFIHTPLNDAIAAGQAATSRSATRRNGYRSAVPGGRRRSPPPTPSWPPTTRRSSTGPAWSSTAASWR
jgi:NAD(P)-dependent dehydrogenase (short-subunit alcohol dehydrogenase family)